MADNKILFTGESHFLVQQDLTFWKNSFKEKFGEQGIHSFSYDSIDISTIQSALLGGGFFSSKNLVIIYGLPKENDTARKIDTEKAQKLEEFLIGNWELIPDDNFLLLVSYKPDKRTKSYKFFSSHCTIKAYPKKKGKDLTLFVLQKLQRQTGAVSMSLVDTQGANYIVSLVGDDLYNLNFECDKLMHYATHHTFEKLTQEQIKNVVYSQAGFDVFKILDKLCTEPMKALNLIAEAQKKGQNEFEFLGMLYRGLKMILGMIELKQEGISSSKQAASILKIHPFAASKQRSKIDTYNEKKLQILNLYSNIIKLDTSIKTGKYPQEGFRAGIKTSLFQFTEITKIVS